MERSDRLDTRKPSDVADDDQMHVYFRLMKSIPLVVKKSDTIKKIRTEFSDTQGVSLVNLKSLFYGGRWLDNEKKVVDYDISNGSIIDVFLDSGFRIKLYAKMSKTGNNIALDVDMRDTIVSLKEKIQHKEGVSISKQDLIYMGEELNDGRTVASYNITDGSAIYAFFRVDDIMQINVRLGGRNTSLKVKSWYTIENVKNMIESTMGIPVNKQEICIGELKIMDHMTLADLNVSQGHELNLNSTYIQIHVGLFLGKTITLQVNPFDTIDTVKELIEEQEGATDVRTQKLVFSGKHLEEHRTLAEYNIQNESLLHVIASQGRELDLINEMLTIFVKLPSGKTTTIYLDASDTVNRLKELIEEKGGGINVEKQRLIYSGRQLENSRTLVYYNVTNLSTIHLVLRLCGC